MGKTDLAEARAAAADDTRAEWSARCRRARVDPSAICTCNDHPCSRLHIEDAEAATASPIDLTMGDIQALCDSAGASNALVHRIGRRMIGEPAEWFIRIHGRDVVGAVAFLRDAGYAAAPGPGGNYAFVESADDDIRVRLEVVSGGLLREP